MQTPRCETPEKLEIFEVKGGEELEATLGFVGEKGWTELHAAAERNEIEKIEHQLDLGVGVDTEDDRGMTPLLAAVHAVSSDAAEMLLGRGANPDKRCNNGQASLDIACMWSMLKITRSLCSHGADVNVQDEDGWTPLHIAVRSDEENKLEVVKSYSITGRILKC